MTDHIPPGTKPTLTSNPCKHEIGPWPGGQQWPHCLKCEIEKLREQRDEFEANLTIAERQVTEARMEIDRLRAGSETTAPLTEAETLLKAWADLLPPNGHLYHQHTLKARQYFERRDALKALPPQCSCDPNPSIGGSPPCQMHDVRSEG